MNSKPKVWHYQKCHTALACLHFLRVWVIKPDLLLLLHDPVWNCVLTSNVFGRKHVRYPNHFGPHSPYTKQAMMRWDFWQLNVWTGVKVFSHLSPVILSDNTRQLLFSTCVNRPWQLMTLLPIYQFPLLKHSWKGPNLCRLRELPTRSHSCGDAMTQTYTIIIWLLSKSLNSTRLPPFFLLLTHQLQGQKVNFLSTTRCHCDSLNSEFSVSHFSCEWL